MKYAVLQTLFIGIDLGKKAMSQQRNFKKHEANEIRFLVYKFVSVRKSQACKI